VGNVVFSRHTHEANHKRQHGMGEAAQFFDAPLVNEYFVFQLAIVFPALTEPAHYQQA
jgi:hypothetical protein